MTGFRASVAKLDQVRARSWLALALLAAAALLLLSSGSGSNAKASDTEARLERVLSEVEGAGEVRAMVLEENGNVRGVLVVAEGADDVMVRLRLQNAVRTLWGMENCEIDVVPMRENGK